MSHNENLPRECGAYTLVERIGAGGMAVVYRAVHTKVGHEVALKMIRKEVQHEPKVLELMQAEVRALAQIRHPHVVEVTDVFDSESGEKCLVMELVRAPTLRQMLTDRVPLIFPDVMQIAMQMASAIAAAHLAGVIHRDLKPDNIAIEERAGPDEQRWHVKVLDFGVAKLTRGAEGQAEHVVGTLAYLAPEILRGQPADGRGDIYALGVVLYEMLAGAPPMDPSSPTELLVKRPGFGNALQEVRPDLPPRFVELIDACTAYDPQQRPPSMQHVIASLQQVSARSAAVVHSAWQPPVTRPWGTMVSLTLAFALLLAVFLWWRFRAPTVAPTSLVEPSSPLGEPTATPLPDPLRKKKHYRPHPHRSRRSSPHPQQNLDESEPLDDPNAEYLDEDAPSPGPR